MASRPTTETIATAAANVNENRYQFQLRLFALGSIPKCSLPLNHTFTPAARAPVAKSRLKVGQWLDFQTPNFNGGFSANQIDSANLDSHLIDRHFLERVRQLLYQPIWPCGLRQW